MKLSFLARVRLRKALKLTALILGIVLLLAVLRFVYLERYIVFDADGVHLDFGGAATPMPAEQETFSEEIYPLKKETVPQGGDPSPAAASYPALDGIYLTRGTLLELKDPEAILPALEEKNTVMLELKTLTGKYLYSTALPDTETAASAPTADRLIRLLAARPGIRLIARIRAFSDSAYALKDFSRALPISGGALWMDENGSYRLDPASRTVLEYLIAQAAELKALGFDEIVFDDFRFPESGSIRYSGNISGWEATLRGAETLSEALAARGLLCSFISEDENILVLSDRVFLRGTGGEMLSQTVTHYASLLPGGEQRLVFLTDSGDHRFSAFSLLAPWEPPASEPQ